MALDLLVQRLKRCRRPMIFYCNALGDHLLMRPTLLALQRVFDDRLGFIGEKRMVDWFFPDVPFRFSHAIAFSQGDGEFHAFDVGEVLALQDRFDGVINLNAWDSPQLQHLTGELGDIPVLSLAATYGHIPPIKTDQHVCDYTFQIPQLLDNTLKLEDFASLPPVSGLSLSKARAVRQLIPSGMKILAVHTSTMPDKQWVLEKFKALLNRFLTANDNYVAVVLDRQYVGLDAGPFESRIFNLDEVDLLTTTALVDHCDAFVGIDSYFLHVADFARVPSVGLFGPTSPAHWGFRFACHRHIAGRSVADIELDDVFEALQALVSQTADPVTS